MRLSMNQTAALARFFDGMKGQRVSKIIQFDTDAISFQLGNKGRVVLSANNQNPALYLEGEESHRTALSTPFSAALRHRLSNGILESVEQVNGDRVVVFDFICLNDIFEEEHLYLVIEMIPTKGNIILLDQGKSVLSALRYAPLTSVRPLLHGLGYEPPAKKEFPSDETSPLDINNYFLSCREMESARGISRKRGLYQNFFREIKGRIKSVRRRIAQIEKDVEEARTRIHDVEIGNYLLTYPEEAPRGTSMILVYDIEVKLDPRKGPNENANAFFKSSRKAKTTIAMGEENIRRSKEELEKLEEILFLAETADDAALPDIIDSFSIRKDHKGPAKKNKNPPQMPYLVRINNAPYLYGKNAKQNNYLTFSYATDPRFYWFHAKDRPGVHVILPKPNPTDAEIQIGCELTLALSNMVDGEVQYTTHKQLRKGSVPGQVILGNYQSAYIRSISKEVTETLSKRKGDHHG